MVQFLPMPAIAYPQNAMINFAPMNQSLQFMAQNNMDRARFGLQQNADLREQDMHPLRMDQTRAQTNLANAHGNYYTGQNDRANAMHPEEIRHRRAQTGLLGAQTGMTNAHARLYDAQAGTAAEVAALRRRQMESLELQRDRGFTLQMLQQLSAAQTPEQFNTVARALAPRLRRVPTFQERDTLLATLGDALEEYDVVEGPNGQVQRVPRGFTPDVSAAMRGLDHATPYAAAAGVGAGGVGGLRAMIPAQPAAPASPMGQMPTDEIFRRFPVLAPVGGAANQPPAVNQVNTPPGPQPLDAPRRQVSLPPVAVPAAVPPVGNAMAQPSGMAPRIVPVVAPGAIPPSAMLPNAGAVPAQGGPQQVPGSPVPRGPMGARQGQVAEIEAQYGAHTTWGQGGQAAPPHSVIQRYWQSVHGGRPPNGMQFQADGSLQPIPGAPQRGGRGSGGSGAAANATQVLSETVPMMENAVEYMLGSNVVTNAISQVPGASTMGVTGFPNARSTLEFGTAAIMHSLSGASTTQREFERYVQAFLPNATDLDNVRRYKLNSLMMVVRAVQSRAAGGAVTDEMMAPIRRQMLLQQRELLGLQNNGQSSAASGGAPTQGGWGGAGNMSTQDIINQIGRR